jgi:hypothetical protein
MKTMFFYKGTILGLLPSLRAEMKRQCSWCEGKGWYPAQDGEDDYEKVECFHGV